jgi:DNA-directed RNA polymerase subunit RPC12/RpoP
MPRVTQEYNLQVINPSLYKEWHPNKNGNLTPNDVTPNSHKKVWWLCKAGHEWEASIANRNKGRKCPYCSGKAVCEDNCLLTINPSLASEWHPEKNNNLTPKDVTEYSHKKVWWVCVKGHEFSAKVSDRSRGNSCPYCAGKAMSEDNCLQAVNQSLAAEWHPTKNGDLTPSTITPGSGKKVWWICEKKHEWKARVANRSRGTGCPYCSGRKKNIHFPVRLPEQLRPVGRE